MDEKMGKGCVTAFRDAESAEELCLLCTPAGRVRFVGSRLQQILDEDLTGRNLNDFLEDALAAQLIGEAFAGRKLEFRCEIFSHRFSGTSEPAEDGGLRVQLFPINGEKVGRAGFLNASRLLVREMNNSLSVLLPAAQMLRDGEEEEKEDYLAAIRLHIYRLMRMARNIDDMTDVESGEMKLSYGEQDLSALVDELLDEVEPYCAALNIRLQRSLPEEPVHCRADGEKVRRMLLNLLSNAMQAQKNGGRIAVSLRESANDQLLISVTDQGGGITGDVFGSVCRCFEHADPLRSSGLGLGLALTRAFAEAHGGSLMLMSGEDGGLSARIVLPRNMDAPLAEVHSWSSSYGSGIDPVQAELSCAAKKVMFRSKKR